MEELMVARAISRKASKSDLPARAYEFGPAPILEGEDARAYDVLLARVSGDVKPSDIFEEMWICDIVDLTWEILRLRQIKKSLLAAERLDVLAEVLSRYVVEEEDEEDDGWAARELADNWAAKDPVATKRVEKFLASANMTMDDLMATAFSRRLEDFERIERLLMPVEARRNAALKEIDRHQATFANTLRGSVENVEEAEFQTIESKLSAKKMAPTTGPHE